MTYWIMTCKRTGETDTVTTCEKHGEQMLPVDEYLTAHDCDDDVTCDFCPEPLSQ
jgi:hypothetical protein